jgi:hypothetical protein
MWFWYVYTLSYKLFSDLVERWRLVGRSTERALHHDAHNYVLYSSCADGQTGATPTPAERERQARRAAAPHGP